MTRYYTEERPLWIVETSLEEYDRDFIEILDFFQFHSFFSGQSARCKTLLDYGWNAPWKKPYWLNRQLKQEASNYNLLFTVNSQNQMEENLSKANLKDEFPNELEIERICIVDNKKNQFMSVFNHIRNAFAHGRFYITNVCNEKVFVMEDVSMGSAKRSVTARMIIRKKTLLQWITLIKSGERNFIDTGGAL